MRLNNVRFSYMYLLEPRTVVKDGKDTDEYSVALVFPKGSENQKLVEEEILRKARERFHDKAESVVAALIANGKTPLHDGDKDFTKDGDIRSGSSGNMILRAKSYAGPLTMVSRQWQKITQENHHTFPKEDRPPRSGDYGDALVDIFITKDDNPGGRRICCAITGLKFQTEGESLGRSEMTFEMQRNAFGYKEPALEDMAS